MRNFDFEEYVTDDGSTLVVSAKNGLMFEDGSKVKKLVLRSDYGPRIGERVMCGKTLVKVAQKRYDSDYRLMVMDEDTKAWFAWR